VPSAPETGYGYIRRGGGAGPIYPIAQFVEKPDVARAKQFVAAGDYLWNSGMFLFQASRYLQELEKFAPDIAKVCAAAYAAATRISISRASIRSTSSPAAAIRSTTR
jgi:mannose-1-phosphate guanylyltransferase